MKMKYAIQVDENAISKYLLCQSLYRCWQCLLYVEFAYTCRLTRYQIVSLNATNFLAN